MPQARLAGGAAETVLLVSHGATVFTSSPKDPTFLWLASLAPRLRHTRAIVVVSAHHVTSGSWEVTSTARPPLLHDHPMRELYGERYSAPGDPPLAARLVDQLLAAGLQARADSQRGLDHGAWLPLRAMVPKADLPIVMLSLNASASFDEHVAVGAALALLRAEGVLVLASGGVTHNQAEFRRRFFSGTDPAQNPPSWSVAFDEWTAATLAMSARRERLATLATFAKHDAFAEAHPTPEHFWPVLVAAGAAGDDAGQRVHQGFQHGLSMSAFLFGELGVSRP